MPRSHTRTLAAAAVMLSAMPATALAGGWATSTLDPLAQPPAAGSPVDVGFTVRQHGVTPLDTDGVAIEVGETGTPDMPRFPARRSGAPGHYVASVTFPAAGTTAWRVIQGYFPSFELTPVRVVPAPANADGGGGPWAWVLAGVVLAGAAAFASVRAAHRAAPAPHRAG